MGMNLKLKKTPKAIKIFTDRTVQQLAFKNQYNKLKSGESADEPHVLMFYGVGGIGKTELLKKLRKSLDEGLVDDNNEKTVENPLYIFYEFNKDKSLEPAEILYKFAQMLFEKYNFRFSLFEAGYCCVNKIEPQKKSNIGDNIGLTLDALSMIPTLNLPVGGIDKVLSGLFDRSSDKNVLEELKKSFEYLDSKESTIALINLFAIDLRINMEKFSKKNKEPLVFFLDSYEILVDEMQIIGEPLNNDLWLRDDNGLILQMPNVLWVISGREKLKWKELGGVWKDASEDNLEQRLITTLSKQDSMIFLQSAGITEDSLREGLYELTHGMPLYLDLCVDLYTNNGKRSLEDFGKSSNELIKRLLINMDDSMKQNIYILACLGSWNEELFNYVFKRFNTGEDSLLFSRLMDKSFICRDTENTGCYSIDRVVGDLLFNGCPQIIKEKTLDAAMKYYSKLFTDVNAISYEGYYYLKRLLDYAVKRYSNDNELFIFYIDIISDSLNLYIDSARFTDAESIMSPFIKRAEKKINGILYAEKLFFDSRLKRGIGYCTENDILLPAQQGYDIYKNFLGEDYPQTLAVLNQISLCCNSLGKNEKALELQKQLFEKCKVVLGEDHPHTLTAMNNLVSTYRTIGRNDVAVELYKQTLEKRIEILGEYHPETVMIESNLAETYNDLGRYEEALDLQKRVFEKFKKVLGEDHLDTLMAMNIIADYYRELDRNEEALELYKQVFEKRKKNLRR